MTIGQFLTNERAGGVQKYKCTLVLYDNIIIVILYMGLFLMGKDFAEFVISS